MIHNQYFSFYHSHPFTLIIPSLWQAALPCSFRDIFSPDFFITLTRTEHIPKSPVWFLHLPRAGKTSQAGVQPARVGHSLMYGTRTRLEHSIPLENTEWGWGGFMGLVCAGSSLFLCICKAKRHLLPRSICTENILNIKYIKLFKLLPTPQTCTCWDWQSHTSHSEAHTKKGQMNHERPTRADVPGADTNILKKRKSHPFQFMDFFFLQ